jgi:hypothetical protein
VSALAVALALAAAALFAVAAAAQQRSAAVPDDRGPPLVLTLVRRPLWWVGILADVGGDVAQAAALGLGSLLLVVTGSDPHRRRFPHGGSRVATRCPVPPLRVVLGRHVPRRRQPRAGDDRMTQSQHPPIDPDTVAEIAPGEGAEPGSTYYGGSEIHDDHVGEGAEAAGDSAAGEPAAGESVTTEAGTFEDLPVTADEQIE